MVFPQADPSGFQFPGGPTYAALLDSDADIAWVRHKVWAADWYVTALAQLAEAEGDNDRYVGTEMALDGALSSLSGAFDAAVGLLIEAIEEANNLPEDQRTASQRYSWGVCRQRILDESPAPRILELVAEVDEALEGAKTDDPVGWLAVLRRLRNTTAHQQTLARIWDASGEVQTVLGLADVPGHDPVAYLRISCDRVSDLTENLLQVANSIGFIGANTPLQRERWID